MRRRKDTGRYTVSGPRANERSFHKVGPALSYAITLASRASKVKAEETYYVRDLDGRPMGYAEAGEDGTVRINRYDK